MGNRHSHSHGSHGHSHGHGHAHGAAKAGQDPALSPMSFAGGVLQLTAHLSAADGNELDVFVQTASLAPLAIQVGVAPRPAARCWTRCASQ
jgi:hypothetical protein